LPAGSPGSPEELLERVKITEKGSSGKSERKEAVRQLPWKQLTADKQRVVQSVVGSSDLFRRMPTLTFEVNPAVYRYFTVHPDVAVSIWRALDVSKYRLQQTGANDYEADSGDGTLGVIEVLSRDDGHQLILCNGEVTSPILKRKIRVQAIMHLVNVHSVSRDGRTFVTHRLDMFVSFPSEGIGAAAKLTKPISNMIIDRNFREVSLFVQMMSLAMTHQPDWVEKLSQKLDGVRPIRRKELVDLTAHVFVQNQERIQSSNETSPGSSDAERRVASKPVDVSGME
jgi:hypothetical protein